MNKGTPDDDDGGSGDPDETGNTSGAKNAAASVRVGMGLAGLAMVVGLLGL